MRYLHIAALGRPHMNASRPVIFWIVTFAAGIAVVVILYRVLLPFVAGAALAYLLNPVAGRIERLGVNRLLATLAIVGVVAAAIAVFTVLTIPRLVTELSDFLDSLPLYVRRLQTLASNPSRPWLSKIVGEGLEDTRRTLDESTAQINGWLVTFLRSMWSGAEALISLVSLTVVAPVVACYLIYDWNRMIAAIDHSIPPTRRETVRITFLET